AFLRELALDGFILVHFVLDQAVGNGVAAQRGRAPVVNADLEMNERQHAALVAADGVAAGPNAAAAAPVAVDDERLGLVRPLPPIIIRARLRTAAEHFVRLDGQRVIVDFDKSVVESGDRGRARGTCRARNERKRQSEHGKAAMQPAVVSHEVVFSRSLGVPLGWAPSPTKSVPCLPSTPMSTSHLALAAICSMSRPSGAPVYLPSR